MNFKKIWRFIWHDDSLLSWIINVILAFVLVKFILYPGLGLILQTTHPVVAVVSGSMEHKMVHPCISYRGGICIERDLTRYEICGNSFSKKEKIDYDIFWKYCGGWYEDKGIEKEDFSNYIFKNGFNTGDIIFLMGKKSEDIKIGDLIVFRSSQNNNPIIHRVIKKTYQNGVYYITNKGDHNPDSRSDETDIKQDDIIGKAFLRLPYLGWIKIGFTDLINVFRGGN